MNELQAQEGGPPVAQGIGATRGDIAKTIGGSLLMLVGLVRRGPAGLALAATGGGLVYSARRRRHVPQRSGQQVDALATITIDASAQDLYERWRAMDRMHHVFQHVLSVEDRGDRRTHWQVRGPLGRRLKWDAELEVDEPGRRMAWRSLPGGDVDHEGEVTFEPAAGDRGTVVTVRMTYSPPGGKYGAAIAGLLGDEPRQTLREDLRRLKQLVETGEIATTVGQSADRVDRAGRAGLRPKRATDAVAIVSRPLQPREIR